MPQDRKDLNQSDSKFVAGNESQKPDRSKIGSSSLKESTTQGSEFAADDLSLNRSTGPARSQK